MFRHLWRLILGFIQDDNYGDLWNSLYLSDTRPKTFGTKIPRR